MAKTMTASQIEMTDGQIDNVCAKLRDALRKHRGEISLEAAQVAIGVENIGMMMFTPFRELAEVFSRTIIRRVRVNCGRKRCMPPVAGSTQAARSWTPRHSAMPRKRRSCFSTSVAGSATTNWKRSTSFATSFLLTRAHLRLSTKMTRLLRTPNPTVPIGGIPLGSGVSPRSTAGVMASAAWTSIATPATATGSRLWWFAGSRK